MKPLQARTNSHNNFLSFFFETACVIIENLLVSEHENSTHTVSKMFYIDEIVINVCLTTINCCMFKLYNLKYLKIDLFYKCFKKLLFYKDDRFDS